MKLFYLFQLLYVLSSPCFSQIKYSEFNKIDIFNESLNLLIEQYAELEILAEGFTWSEGPVWNQKEEYLLFTDVPKNTIYKWDLNEGVTIYIRPSGFYDENPPGNFMGANGLLYDKNGNLLICEHGID